MGNIVLSPFRLMTPTTVSEAAAELSRLGDAAKIYAGGAELLLLLRHGIVQAEYLVNIKRIPGIDDIAVDGELVRIGAAVTHRRLERDLLVRERLPILAEAESHIGNIRVRAQGTIGGNLCFADPHADPGTALLVHEAFAVVAGPGGTRRIPLEEFFVGTYETALAPDELLTEIQVQPLSPGWNGAFLRIEQYYRPTANVAAAVQMGQDRIQDVRLAVGCIGPRALRLSEIESELVGLPLEEADQKLAGSKAYLAERLEPVDDLLGSADYKIHITRALLRRALHQASQYA